MEQEEEVEEVQPLIARRKTFTLAPMDEVEAIEQMNLLGHEDFFIFYNAQPVPSMCSTNGATALTESSNQNLVRIWQSRKAEGNPSAFSLLVTPPLYYNRFVNLH